MRFFANSNSYDIATGGAHFYDIEFHKCGSPDQILTLQDSFTVENNLNVYNHSGSGTSLTVKAQSDPTIAVQGDLIFPPAV